MPAWMHKKKGKKAPKAGLKAKAKGLKKPKVKAQAKPGPWGGIGGMG